MTDLFRGPAGLLRGFHLIARPKIRVFAFLPILLSALLYAGLLYYASGHIEDLQAFIERHTPEALSWLASAATILLWIVLLLALSFTFSLLASLVASPFNGPLSEQAEAAIMGRKPNTRSIRQTLAMLPRILGQELKKILYALLLAIPFLILLFIPVVGQILWFGYGAWITALAFADFALDNHGYSFRDMRRILRMRFLLTMGFGGLTMLALTVPILNLFTVPAAVAGATALYCTHYGPEAARRGLPPPRGPGAS